MTTFRFNVQFNIFLDIMNEKDVENDENYIKIIKPFYGTYYYIYDAYIIRFIVKI